MLELNVRCLHLLDFFVVFCISSKRKGQTKHSNFILLQHPNTRQQKVPMLFSSILFLLVNIVIMEIKYNHSCLQRLLFGYKHSLTPFLTASCRTQLRNVLGSFYQNKRNCLKAAFPDLYFSRTSHHHINKQKTMHLSLQCTAFR